jgi:hypothetical protein
LDRTAADAGGCCGCCELVLAGMSVVVEVVAVLVSGVGWSSVDC